MVKNKLSEKTGIKPFESVSISKTVITGNKGKKVELFREKKSWFVGSKKWPADEDRITRLKNGIKNINLEDIISSRKETYKDFEVNKSSAVQIEIITEKGGKEKIFVGKRSPEYNKTYIRINNDPSVYMAESINRGIVQQEKFYYKDKILIRIPRQDIEEVKISKDKDSYTFQKDTTTWNNFTNKLKNLKASEFIELNENLENKFKSPFINIEVISFEDIHTLYPVIKSEDKYYAKTSDEIVYVLRKNGVENLIDFIENK
ncbi:MAG: DUF4340 domain-containing protein [Elusimicrobiota bacterium]